MHRGARRGSSRPRRSADMPFAPSCPPARPPSRSRASRTRRAEAWPARGEPAGETELAERRNAVTHRAPRAAEAIARATARSAPGSSILTPPATLTNTSAVPSGTPACRASTATIIASLFGFEPWFRRDGAWRDRFARRGPGSRAGSAVFPRARPRPLRRPRPASSRRRARRDRGRRRGLWRSSRTPRARSSSRTGVDGAEHAVPAWYRSPSNWRTQSTRCSSTPRAGDRAVLGHVADEHRRHPALLRDPEEPQRRSSCTCARPSPARIRARRRKGSARSRSRRRLAGRARGSRRRPRARSPRGWTRRRRRRAGPALRLDLGDRLLAGNEQCGSAGAGDRAERREQQRRLANTWLAADEDERRGNETAAEYTVELGHSRL